MFYTLLQFKICIKDSKFFFKIWGYCNMEKYKNEGTLEVVSVVRNFIRNLNKWFQSQGVTTTHI